MWNAREKSEHFFGDILPEEYFADEAVKRREEEMKNIILPLMMSSVTICLFLTLSRAFMVYDVNLSLTAGGPYGTTEMAAMHVYEKAFTSRQFGVGQAEALILFVIVTCISGIQVYLTKKQEVEA